MSFVGFAPVWVAALLAAVAALVVALYLLRPPPVRITVASTLIWQRVLGARRGPSERWRWWLALLLSLALALALAAAIARPERPVGADGVAADALAIVVDTAPGMAATHRDGGTRFSRAVAEARARIAALDPTARVLVADTTRGLAALEWTAPSAARAKLDALQPAAGGEARMPALPPLPDRGGANPAVVVITDGVAPLALPPGAREVSVFAPADNVGITAFAVRAPPADPLRWSAFVEIANAGARPARVRLELTGAGRAPLVRELDVPARGYAQQTVPVADFASGPLRARVSMAGDAFAGDDAAFAFLPFDRVLKVALVTPGNPELARALALDPRVKLTVLAPAQWATRGSGFDAAVFDRFAPADAPPLPVLAWKPPKVAWLPAPASTGLVDPVASAWALDERVLDNVSLADVVIDRAAPWRGALGGGTRAVASTATGDALVIAADAPPRRLAVGFGVDDSNFATLASFPMFVSNALAWLAGEAAPIDARVGPVVVPLERARVRGVLSGAVDTRLLPGATLFTATQPDFFTADAPGGRLRVLVAPGGIGVTDLDASRHARADAAVERARGASASAADGPDAPTLPRAPWAWLLLFAAGVLLVEWALYHRRLSA
ncbi:MAG: BatA domain-containing protein [Burkholderiales bacterium]|nr:BatA domain-containing protein [Burkholderiales bacterium]